MIQKKPEKRNSSKQRHRIPTVFSVGLSYFFDFRWYFGGVDVEALGRSNFDASNLCGM